MKTLRKNTSDGYSLLAFAAIVILLVLAKTSFAGAAPSGAFTVGDQVITVRKARVFLKPPTAGKFAGEQAPGVNGRVVAGPVRVADAWWWWISVAAPMAGSRNGPS
jgi:hypothetical protein